MKNGLQPPIRILQNRVDVDYEYDNAKDEGRIHQPLMGGGWVTHYERNIATMLKNYALEPATNWGWQNRRNCWLQEDMIKLEIARRGFYIKEVQRLDPDNDTHRLCKIGISNHRRMNHEAQ